MVVLILPKTQVHLCTVPPQLPQFVLALTFGLAEVTSLLAGLPFILLGIYGLIF